MDTFVLFELVRYATTNSVYRLATTEPGCFGVSLSGLHTWTTLGTVVLPFSDMIVESDMKN